MFNCFWCIDNIASLTKFAWFPKRRKKNNECGYVHILHKKFTKPHLKDYKFRKLRVRIHDTSANRRPIAYKKRSEKKEKSFRPLMHSRWSKIE